MKQDPHSTRKDQNLTESVYRSVRNDLVLCRIAPSSRIKTSELAKRLGVSLASVREAMARLTSEDLVGYEPQRGYFAAPISAQRLQDLTDLRLELETMAMQQSLANFSSLDEIRLDEAMEAMLATAQDDGTGNHVLTEEWISAHAAFHDALVAACRNSVLLQVRRQLFDQAERYRSLAAQLYLAKKIDDIAADHRPMVDAVRKRDAADAVRLIRQHVSETTTSLLRSRVDGRALVPRQA